MEKATPTSQSSGDSPSMTLLMRLQQLRQWQEKQRDNLQRSSSFQNSTSINSSYESSLSISPSSILSSSVSHSVVSHSLKSKPLLAYENLVSSHLNNSISYSSSLCNDSQILCESPQSSNSSPIPALNFDQFMTASASDISKTTNLQLSCPVSSYTNSTSDLFPSYQYKEHEDFETQLVMKEEKSRTTESTLEKNVSTACLSFNSPEINLKKKSSGLPMNPSLDDKTQVSTGMPSDVHDFLSKPISLKTTDFETSSPISLYFDTATNSPQSIQNNEENLNISIKNQDNCKEKYQNDNSEIKVKESIKDRCNENNIKINKIDIFHNNFDDIPIRTQSQNFQVLLSKNFEGNQITNKNQSSAPKFSFLKKGVGSAVININDVDSGVGSGSSISGNATEAESSTENKIKIKKTFLRKGEGTSRFGMKQPRLKKSNVDIPTFETIPENLEYKNVRIVNKNKLILKNLTAQSSKNISDVDDGKTLGIKQSINLQLKEIPSTRYTNANIQNYNKSSEDNNKYRSRRKENREVEEQELSAFEQLEELADDSSFCSNSSTVIKLLQKGLRSASSTPLRSPAPFDFAESPIPVNDPNSLESQTDQELLSLSQVLEQCKALVQLEKEGNSNITQKDIDYLVESILSDQTVSVHSVSEYLKNLQQGTIHSDYSTTSYFTQNQKPRVHFRKEGVDVHEFETPDSDSDTTLTDMQSIDEEVTDLVTTSDLEALAHLNLHGMFEHVPEQVSDQSHANTDRNIDFNNHYSEFEQDRQNIFLKNTKKYDSVQKVLEFSPPRQPPNSASHLVWSIFGQDKINKKLYQNKKGSNLKDLPNKDQNCTKVSQKSPSANLGSYQRDLRKGHNSDDLEIDSHKTLLMAKICELENETTAFKKKNAELQKLQESVKLDQENLSKEREAFKKQITEHEYKLREAIDRERNRLWKERQELKQLNQEQMTLETARTQSLEIVMLKEKFSDAEEELKKKESSHQFAVRKFMEKIKVLEQENKKLKVDLASLQTIEKENLNLKHQLDRVKLSSKGVLSDKTMNKTQNLKKKVTIANAIKKSIEIKQKPKSINEVNKELDRELLTNEEANLSIKDIYPSKNLNIQDKGRVAISHALKSKLPFKEVKDFTINNSSTSLKGQNKNEFENESKKPSAIIEEADSSFERYSSLSSPSKLINDDTHNIGIANQGNVSYEVFKDKEQDMHSPGSANIDFTENCRSDGTKEIIYANGNKKEIFPNGVTVMNYYNGDCKEQHKDKTVYIYGTDHTKHITFTDGKEIVEFPNGQKESTYPDGSSEVTFPDQSVKKISNDGTEMCLMKDGTVVRTNPDGSKVFEFPGGQREVHSGSEKRREYPDGTIKILYDDGRVETRYKNGRIRMKDKQGNILKDTHGKIKI